MVVGSSQEQRTNGPGESKIRLDCSKNFGTYSIGNSTDYSEISSSKQKRKSCEELVSQRRATKGSKSVDSQTDVAQVKLKDGSIENGLIQSIGEARGNSQRGKDSETYGNRIQYCLVISPAGRPLRAYKVVKELLEPLGDAIFGHKSLVEDGKILHGDVSENNIIITESATDGDPKGRLTDLEVVKELDSVRSGADY